MIRLLGSGMVLLAAASYICKDREAVRREDRKIEDILEAIECLRTAIRWEKSPLPDSIFAQSRRLYAGEYFQDIYTKLQNSMTLQEAWTDTFCRMKPQRISEILCGITFTGDSIFLIDRLAYVLKEIRSFQMQERGRQAIQQKVKCAAAISAASTVIILLL